MRKWMTPKAYEQMTTTHHASGTLPAIELRVPRCSTNSARGPHMDCCGSNKSVHALIYRGRPMQRRDFLKLSAAMAGAATLPMSLEAFGAKDPVRVGVLHSLSGTMAISETALKNTALMTFEQINAAGGVLGRPIEPVVVDLASNWPLFAEKARQLITQDKVAAVFGCWTSVSRKSILPVFEELDHHLHEPVMIGEVKADGQFDVVWKTKGPVRAQPWSPFIAGNEPKQDR